MKKLIPLFLILMAYSAFSQHLHVFNVDTTDFPIMRAKFFATDASENQITNLNKSDFKITENGEEKNILSVNCQKYEEPEAISTVITIDVSGSMNGNSIELAKETAKGWVNGLPLGKSECAITSFTMTNQYVQDFTTDRNSLLDKISGLSAGGATDFNAALIDPIAGGLLALENAKYQKVLVLITDGFADGSEADIINKAKSLGAVVYCVTLGFNCPDILKNVAEQTGGMWFENVTNIDKTKEIYSKLLLLEQGVEQCEIEWESNIDCTSNKELSINLLTNNSQDVSNYQVPNEFVASLGVEPNILNLYATNIGDEITGTFRVYADNSDFDIEEVIIENSDLTISPSSGIIEKNTYQDFTVTYTASDSSCYIEYLNVNASPCSIVLYVAIGIRPDYKKKPTIKLISPNGGETFVVGSDSLITWTGADLEQKVSIEYSTDSGNAWNNLGIVTGDTSFIWKNIPLPESDNCLVRVSQSKTENELLWSSHPYYNRDVTLYNNDQNFAVSGKYGIGLYNTKDMKFIDAIQYKYRTYGVRMPFCIDQKRQILYYADSVEVFKYDLSTNKLVGKLSNLDDTYNKLSYRPNSDELILENSAYNIFVYNLSTEEKSKEIFQGKPKDYAQNGIFNEDGSLFALKRTSVISILDAKNNYKEIHNISENEVDFYTFTWHPNNKDLIIETSDGICLWDSSSDEIDLVWSKINYDKQWPFRLKGFILSPNSTYVSWVLQIYEQNIFRLYRTNLNNLAVIDSVDIDINNIYSLNKTYNPNIVFLETLKNSNNQDFVQFNWKSKEKIYQQPYHSSYAHIVRFSHSGDYLASFGFDSKLIIWNVANGKPFQTKTIPSISPSIFANPEISWSNDDKFLCISLGQYSNGYPSRSTGIYSFPNLDSVSFFKASFTEFNPYKPVIASLTINDTLVYLYRPPFKVKTDSLKHINCEAITWSEDGKYLLTSSDSLIKVWDASTFELVDSIIDERIKAFDTFFTSSDNYHIVTTATNDYEILEWDIKNNQLIQSTYIGLGRLNPFKASHRLGIYSFGKANEFQNPDHDVYLFDKYGKNILSKISIHQNSVYDIDIFDQNQLLATCSEDYSVKVSSIMSDPIQADTSDAVFSIVAPEISSQDIDMGDVVVNSSKDSVITEFIDNIGQWDCRIDSIYFKGADADYFKLNGPTPVYTVMMGESMMSEFRFSPTEVRDYSAQVVVVTQADTLYQNIRGRGVEPKILVVKKDINFGRVYIGDTKDTLDAITITNAGKIPVNISRTEHAFPNATDFTTIKGAGPFTLQPGDTCRMDLAFTANSLGRTSGLLLFHHDAPESPHQVTLHAEGYATNTIDIDKIVFSPQRVGTTNDSTIVNYFHNQGTFENKIESVFLAKDDFEQFEIKNLQVPFYLNDNEHLDLEISFMPTSVGHKQTNLYMVCQSDTIIKTVEGVGTSPELTLITNNIDFGTIDLGRRVDSTSIPILANTGTEDISISQVSLQGADIADYETGNGFSSSTLSQGDTLFVDLDFYPKSVGIKNSVINIMHSLSNISTTVTVTGEAIASENAQASIHIPHLEARVGQVIEVPIILDNITNTEQIGSGKISVDVEFNKYVMLPTESTSEFEQNTGIVTYEDIEILKNVGATLATMSFKVLLGDKELSPITISKIRTEDSNLLIDNKSGSLRLLDLCEQGGKRLYNPEGLVGITSLSPNPAEDKLQLEVNLIEKGQTKLELYDASGNAVLTIIDENINKPGEFNFNESLESIPSGAYSIILTTPTFRQVKNLIIHK